MSDSDSQRWAQMLRGMRLAGIRHTLIDATRLPSAPDCDDLGSPTEAAPVVGREGEGMPDEDRSHQVTLQVIEREVASCTRCPELVQNRTQTVFGVGPPRPRLCFLGEAPGADEDRQGEPFVGRSGQLLTKIIEACQWRRDDVYILNVVKCRPPGNRTPLGDEISNCRHFFERQLEALQPEFICCLGTVAAHALLETKTPVGRLRGQFHSWRSAQVLITYHPSYLLRNPAAKKDTWQDMQLLMTAMESP